MKLASSENEYRSVTVHREGADYECRCSKGGINGFRSGKNTLLHGLSKKTSFAPKIVTSKSQRLER